MGRDNVLLKINFSVTLKKRGCYADLVAEEKAVCDDDKNTACYKCDKDKCNSLGREEHKCVQCTTEDDEKCLEDPSSITSVRCPVVIATESRCYILAVSCIETFY